MFTKHSKKYMLGKVIPRLRIKIQPSYQTLSKLFLIFEFLNLSIIIFSPKFILYFINLSSKSVNTLTKYFHLALRWRK